MTKESHYHVEDLRKALKSAIAKNEPVYAAEGPCGGCDLIIKPKILDPKAILERLENIEVHKPIYPGDSPCGGCDICIKKGM